MADWQPGDLALCVGIHTKYPPQVCVGSIHQVEYVWHGCEDHADATHIDTALDLTGIDRMDGDLAYWAGNFIKITPGADIEGIEAEKRLPSKVGQDA